MIEPNRSVLLTSWEFTTERIERWADAVASRFDIWGAWLLTHEHTADLTTLWMLTVGFYIMAAYKGITYTVIRYQEDRTLVGKALKGQKAWECPMFAFLATLFCSALILSYNNDAISIWVRITLRVLTNVGLVGALIYGGRFIDGLRRENWGRPDDAIAHLKAQSFLGEDHGSTSLSPMADDLMFGGLATAMPIVVADSGGTIRHTTDSFDLMIGGNVRGKNLTDIMPDRYRERHLAGLQRYIATGETKIIGRVIHVSVLRQDGREVPSHLFLTASTLDGDTWFTGALMPGGEEVNV